MSGYDDDGVDEIVLSYFGDDEPAACPDCGQVLSVDSQVIPAFGLHLKFVCEHCEKSADWQQPQPARDWKDLHLQYFEEALLADRPIRCPIDDSFVTYAEFENRVIHFVCPYCNRRGGLQLSREQAAEISKRQVSDLQ